MKKSYKILISIIAIVFGFLSAGMGFSLVAQTDFTFPIRVVLNFVFLMAPVSTAWLVGSLFRKQK